MTGGGICTGHSRDEERREEGEEGRKKEKHVNTESRKVTRRSMPMESKQNVDETKMEM